MIVDLGKPAEQAVFAALVGISQPAASDLVRRAVLRPGDALGEWLQAYCAHLRAVAAGRVESPELTEQRTRVARIKGDRDALRLAREAGRLAEWEPMTKALAGVVTSARDAFMALPDRAATQCAAETDPARVHTLLAGEIERTLADLARSTQAMADAARQSAESAP